MRIGIIGTRWGLMHVGGFRGAGAEVVALCGKDAVRTRAVAAAEGIGLGTTDPSELFAACDAVVVASPDALHHSHVSAALRAGRPVLCEKPLTFTATESDDLQRRATESGLGCAVNFPYRMLPPVAALYHSLRTRTPVRHAAVTLRSGFLSRNDTSGSVRGDSGDFGGLSHVLDAALWLIGGRPVRVQAVLSGRPAHSAALHVELHTGAVLGVTHLAAPEPGIWGEWTLIGDDWEAAFAAGYRPALGGWRLGPARLFVQQSWQELTPAITPQPGEREPWAQAHVATARAFMQLLGGAPRDALASFGDGGRVQHVLDAALRSESAQRRVAIAD